MKNNKIVAHSQKQLKKKTIIFKPFETYIQMNFVVICNKQKILKTYKILKYQMSLNLEA